MQVVGEVEHYLQAVRLQSRQVISKLFLYVPEGHVDTQLKLNINRPWHDRHF